jgi:hypothetical protein
MKLAILFPGQERLFPIMKYNFLKWKTILEQSWEVDVFLHRPNRAYFVPYVMRDKKAYSFWKDYLNVEDDFFSVMEDEEGMSYIPFEKGIQHFYEKIGCFVEVENNFEEIEERLKLETDLDFFEMMKQKYYGHLHFFHSLDKCNQMKKDHEEKLNFHYDMVICTQPDIYFYRDDVLLLNEKMRRSTDNYIYSSYMKIEQGIPVIDRCFFGNGKMIDRLLDGIFENITSRFYNSWNLKNQPFPSNKPRWAQQRFPNYGLVLNNEILNTISGLENLNLLDSYKTYMLRLVNAISADDEKNASWKFETHLGINSLIQGCNVQSYEGRWYQMMFSAHGNGLGDYLKLTKENSELLPSKYSEIRSYLRENI